MFIRAGYISNGLYGWLTSTSGLGTYVYMYMCLHGYPHIMIDNVKEHMFASLPFFSREMIALIYGYV
jgi:hypothetical protein